MTSNYYHLTKQDRIAIKHSLDRRISCRKIAKELSRSPSTISAEVFRNRTISVGKNKNQLIKELPERTCLRLEKWPFVCNGCKYKKGCRNHFKAEYNPKLAQAYADERLVESRVGINRTPEEMERISIILKNDLSRGLSPAQIAEGRKNEFSACPSTIYKWISSGLGNISSLDCRRKVRYKKRNKKKMIKSRTPDSTRSYKAFLNLPQDQQDQAVEMDTVIGKRSDSQCLLTLYFRPSKTQIVLLIKDKTANSVCEAFDSLEQGLGKETFKALFSNILTDNGTEFSDPENLEKSLDGGKRCNIFYCDPRQSQQKGACEKNHVEIRKILPKGMGISFDDLTALDAVYIMNQINSQSRGSLAGKCSYEFFKFAHSEDAELLMDLLSLDVLEYENLNLTLKGLNVDRAARNLKPLGNS